MYQSNIVSESVGAKKQVHGVQKHTAEYGRWAHPHLGLGEKKSKRRYTRGRWTDRGDVVGGGAVEVERHDDRPRLPGYPPAPPHATLGAILYALQGYLAHKKHPPP